MALTEQEARQIGIVVADEIMERLGVLRQVSLLLHSIPQAYGSPGIVIDEAAARAGPCRCVEYKPGKLLHSAPGIIGPLDDKQVKEYCPKPVMVTHPETVEGTGKWQEAVETCRRETEPVPKSERLGPWLGCISRELKARGIDAAPPIRTGIGSLWEPGWSPDKHVPWLARAIVAAEGNPAVRLVGVGERPPPPWVSPEEEVRMRVHRERLREVLAFRRPYEPVDDEAQKLIIEVYDEGRGLKMWQIAEQFGIGRTAVHRAIHRGRSPLRKAITKERLQDVVSMRRLGLSVTEIAKRLKVSREFVYYLLHRAGEYVDFQEATRELARELLAISDRLRPPVSVPKLSKAADEAWDIADSVVLHLDIMPADLPAPWVGDLHFIHTRAQWAEDVLRNGAWCLAQMPKEPLPVVRERLGVCGEAAREVAVDTIENKESWETKVMTAIFEANHMMKEVGV